MEITSRDRSAAQTRASGQVVPLSPLFDRFEWHRRGMWHRAGCSMLALDGAQAFPAAPELLFRMIERRRVALHPDLDIRINVSRDRPEPESRADRTSLNASLATSICRSRAHAEAVIHCNSIQLPALPIQFNSRHQARGIWVRSETTPASIFPSIPSIWPIATADGTNVAISGAAPFCQQHLPATSARPASSANNICQHRQHLPVTSAEASDICQHHLPTSAAHRNHCGAGAGSPRFLLFVLFGTIYAAMASNSQHLNSQHLNGPSIWASICSSIWASISSISASICPSIWASISSISASICQHLASTAG